VFAPDAPANQPPTAGIVTPVGGEENSNITLSGAASSDPNNDITTYLWDLNNDGDYDDDDDATGLTTNFSRDLPGNYTVRLKVIDSANQQSTTTATVTVADVAPTANAGGPYSVTEGSPLTLHGSGSNTSGDAVTTYEWDLNYNGVTFDVDATAQNIVIDTDQPRSFTVGFRVKDDDLQYSAIQSTTVTITNLIPTANAGADQIGVTQQSFTFSGSATPVAGDAIVAYAWDLDNNGSFETSGQNASRAYAAVGIYTVALRVTDDDGESSIDTLTVDVRKAYLNNGTLLFGGTTGNDKITITKVTGGVYVDSQDTNKTLYAPASKVIIFGGDGADSIQSNSDVPVAFEIYGGAGNDTLKGGLVTDIIVGGGGNDQITGNDGRDLVIGGTGADALTSNNGDDLLIAARTAFDEDPISLRAVLAEWNSGRSYLERIANLRGTGTGSRANGNVFLKAEAPTTAGITVFDDGVLDTLTGNAANDWFFANIDSGVRDKTDVKTGEIVDDVDLVML
jgi:PKD repeat protein